MQKSTKINLFLCILMGVLGVPGLVLVENHFNYAKWFLGATVVIGIFLIARMKLEEKNKRAVI